MNKILKYLIGVFGILLIGVNLCNAGFNGEYNNQSFVLNSNVWTTTPITSGFACYMNMTSRNFQYRIDSGTAVGMTRYYLYCFESGTNVEFINTYSSAQNMTYFVINPPTTTCPTCPTIDSNYCTSNNLCPSCPTCQECEDQYTSLECQTEYNLIPLSSVTKSYCELNFNLIDPSTCPTSEGTGVVNWSSLFINNTQYAGNDNIEIFIPDFIGWSIIYNTGSNYIDIEGYNADTEYIENVIDKENMQPTNEDFAYLMQGLQVYAPYLFLFLLFAFTIWLVNKLFHHK